MGVGCFSKSDSTHPTHPTHPTQPLRLLKTPETHETSHSPAITTLKRVFIEQFKHDHRPLVHARILTLRVAELQSENESKRALNACRFALTDDELRSHLIPKPPMKFCVDVTNDSTLDSDLPNNLSYYDIEQPKFPKPYVRVFFRIGDICSWSFVYPMEVNDIHVQLELIASELILWIQQDPRCLLFMISKIDQLKFSARTNVKFFEEMCAAYDHLSRKKILPIKMNITEDTLVMTLDGNTFVNCVVVQEEREGKHVNVADGKHANVVEGEPDQGEPD